MKTVLRLKNDLNEIERLANSVLAFGDENKLKDNIIWEIRLVLEEIVTNIISYGYEDKENHIIVVSIDTGEKDITISIKDDGIPYNILEHPKPDLEIPFEDRDIGGMGIYMVREIMDEVNYKREDNMNQLVMKRSLSGA